jgi:small redox-active disulfide protein 2
MSSDSVRQVRVYGTGCANCRRTVQLIEDAARSQQMSVAIEKVERIEDIAMAGVMRTPAVAIDGRMVHSGGVPAPEVVQAWLVGA